MENKKAEFDFDNNDILDLETDFFDQKVSPNCFLGQIEKIEKLNSKVKAYGIGLLISYNCVLTIAENVTYHDGSLINAKDLRFYPFNAEYEFYREIKILEVYLPNEYINKKGEKGSNYAILKLMISLGNILKKTLNINNELFSRAYRKLDLDDLDLIVFGTESDSKLNVFKKQHVKYVKLKKLDQDYKEGYFAFSQNKITRGSPVFVLRNAKYHLVGIHSSLKLGYNLALKINEKVYLDIAKQLEEFGEKDEEKIKELLKNFNEESESKQQLSQFEQAVDFYEKKLKTSIDEVGMNHLDTAVCYDDLGNIHFNKKNYEKALEFFKKSLEIKIREIGEGDIRLSPFFQNVGFCLKNLNDNQNAYIYFKKCLDLNLKVHGDKYFENANLYEQLGYICSELNEIDKSFEYHKLCLEIRNEILEENNEDIAISYNNIGNSLSLQGKFNESLEYFQKFLKISLKVNGESHFSTSNAFNNIGNTYNKLKNYDLAIENLEKSLKIRINCFGENHVEVSNSYTSLGHVYINKDENLSAISNFKKSLKIRKIIYKDKKNVSLISECYENIAETFCLMKNLETSLKYFEKSMKFRSSIRNGFNEANSNLLLKMSSLYTDMNNIKKSNEFLQKCLMIRISLFGENHVKVSNCYDELASNFIKLQEYSKAIQSYEVSLRIKINLNNNKGVTVGNAYNNLANIYSNISNYQKAYDFYMKALKIYLDCESEHELKIAYSNIRFVSNHIDEKAKCSII